MSGTPTYNMEKIMPRRDEELWTDVGTSYENRPTQGVLASCCRGPMLHKDQKELSQVRRLALVQKVQGSIPGDSPLCSDSDVIVT